MLAMCAWVAFGPGPRHFIGRSSVPFLGHSSERSGRVGFGIAATLLGVACVARLVGGLRTLLRR
jgi:hypothetical protein